MNNRHHKCDVGFVLLAATTLMAQALPAFAGRRIQVENARNVQLKYCGGFLSITRNFADHKLHLQLSDVQSCSLVDINQSLGSEVTQYGFTDYSLNERPSYSLRIYSQSGNTWDDFIIENPPQPVAEPVSRPAPVAQKFTCQCFTADGLSFPFPGVTVEAASLGDALNTMADSCKTPSSFGYRGTLIAARAACR